MTAYLVLASLALLLLALLSGRVIPALAFAGCALGFHATGLVDQAGLLASFANPALAALLALLLVSIALERSPLLDSVAARLLQGRPTLAVLRLTGLAALLSAFVNNTAVVSALLGPIARQRAVPPSRVLLPLSYAALLGGITTLVGTSTNLVVHSLAVEAGLPGIEMFQLAWAGVPMALVCLGVLAMASRWLPLREHSAPDGVQRYFLEALVTSGSPLAGRSIEQNHLRKLDGLFLLELVRGSRLISPVAPSEVLQQDDRLIFAGEVAKVSSLQALNGLQFFGHPANELLRSNLVEAVITSSSELVHQTLRQIDFRTTFGAGVVGIRRGDQQLSGQLGRIVLRAGDCLLLATGPDFGRHRNLDRNLVVISGTPIRPRLTPTQNRVALAGFASVVALAALGWVPLLTGLLVLLGAFLATGLVTAGEIRRRFPFELALIVGSALVIARVMESSGAAALIARAIHTAFEAQGVWGAFIGVYLATLVLTEVITNSAAAALGFPIALAAARAYGADPTPFVLAVCYAAGGGFLIPFGYQTHLMVFSTGRYRLQDFLRIGLPVSVAYSATALALVPMWFPFS